MADVSKIKLGSTTYNIKDTSKLPLSGGTLTGGITFNKVGSAINYTGSQATYSMIKFKDNTADTYGNGIVIGGGGLVVIGGGESADTVAAQHSSGGDEELDLTSDSSVMVYTNVQSGWDSRKLFTFGSDGTFNSPSTIKQNGTAVSLNGHTHNYAGSSSAGGAATTALACSGNSATATKLQTARTIFNKSFDGSGNVVGQPMVYGSYNATANSRYSTSGLQVRENDLVSNTQSDIAYAPAIGFHWSGRNAGSLIYHSDGNFYLRQIDFTSRASLDANLIGNASTATKATQDESGNNIKASYAASFSISDHTITLKNKNGASLGTVTVPDNNTWRGIQNNLTSDSTTDSLSAAQGKALKTLVDGKAANSHTHNYIPLSNSRYRTLRDFTNGTLITTDLDGGTTTSSVPFLLKVQGNGYGDGYVEFYAQGYVYNLGNGYSNYIQIYGYSVGKKAPSKVYAFKDSNGKLAFWFERLGYWHGYDVYVGNMSESASSFNLPNHVVSITNAALPSSRTYSTEITIQQVYATDNTSKNTIGSASGWSAGSTPTLGTAIAADDITAWSAGSTPTLGTAIAADDITAWTTNTPTAVTKKTVVTGTTSTNFTVSGGVLTLPASAITSATTGDSVTVTAGTKASLSYTARSIPNVTSVGSVPSLSYTARSIPNVTSVGSVPSLTVTNVTNVLKAT